MNVVKVYNEKCEHVDSFTLSKTANLHKLTAQLNIAGFYTRHQLSHSGKTVMRKFPVLNTSIQK